MLQPLLQAPQSSTSKGDLNQATSKVHLIKLLTGHISITDAGLPEYLIRPDMLPSVNTLQELQADEAKAAQVPISYAQGYPTFADSEQPLWFQASYEPDDVFEAFNAYLAASAKTGSRNLNTQNVEWFYLYFWAARSRAYDLFRKVAFGQLQLDRQITMCDSHFTKGEALLQQAFDRLSNVNEHLSPRDTIELAKLGANLQHGALDTANPNSVSTKAGVEIDIQTGTLLTHTHDSSPEALIVNRALADPESANILQQIMIRLYMGTE